MDYAEREHFRASEAWSMENGKLKIENYSLTSRVLKKIPEKREGHSKVAGIKKDTREKGKEKYSLITLC